MGIAEETHNPARLHVAFFPLPAHGHMLPLLDIARLFASCGHRHHHPDQRHHLCQLPRPHPIHLQILPFPGEKVGLPAGIENFEHIVEDDDIENFVQAIELLTSSLERLLSQLRPSCLVSDQFVPMMEDVAVRLGIPRVSFHGCGHFGISTLDVMRRNLKVIIKKGEKEFVVPDVPRKVRRTMRKVSPQWKEAARGRESAMMRIAREGVEAEGRSYDVIMNIFEELDAEFADHYRRVEGRRVWSIDPVSLCDR